MKEGKQDKVWTVEEARDDPDLFRRAFRELYYRLLKKVHPDKQPPERRAAAHEIMIWLVQAYEEVMRRHG